VLPGSRRSRGEITTAVAGRNDGPVRVLEVVELIGTGISYRSFFVLTWISLGANALLVAGRAFFPMRCYGGKPLLSCPWSPLP
jgi:hypothetical protein